MGVKVDLLLISLLIGTCLSNSVYSVIAPFYPQVALKNGLSDGLIGIVFSSYPIAATVVSPIYTYMLLNIGRKKVLVFASIQLILSQIGFMMAPSLKGNTLFVVSLISRAVQGTGSVGITAGSYAVIANNYKDNLTTLMAVM